MTIKVRVERKIKRYRRAFTAAEVAMDLGLVRHRAIDILGTLVKQGTLLRLKDGVFANLGYTPVCPKCGKDHRSVKERAYAEFRESLHLEPLPELLVNTCSRFEEGP